MPSPINKKVVKHLAELARLELTPKEEDRLMKDLQGILAHFEDLQALDTSEVKPMTGGTGLRNIFREDEARENKYAGAGVELFPENEKGFLRIPAVFEEKIE